MQRCISIHHPIKNKMNVQWRQLRIRTYCKPVVCNVYSIPTYLDKPCNVTYAAQEELLSICPGNVKGGRVTTGRQPLVSNLVLAHLALFFKCFVPMVWWVKCSYLKVRAIKVDMRALVRCAGQHSLRSTVGNPAGRLHRQSPRARGRRLGRMKPTLSTCRTKINIFHPSTTQELRAGG